VRLSLETLRWYWSRARIVSFREAAHRIVRQLDKVALRYAWRWKRGTGRREGHSREAFQFCVATAPQLPSLPWRFSLTAHEIDRLLDGQSPALGLPWRWHDDAAVWRVAPDTRRLWPHIFFGDIPFRPGNPYGDARVVWEPARLQQLVTLALLAREGTRAGEAVELLEKQFISWVEANPPLTGIHYASAMECALRILAVCHAVDLARGRLSSSSPVWRLLPGLIENHASIIERRLSLYSSRGNHTIAECAGLIYAALLFPELPRAGKWARLGLSWIIRESQRQILDDGGGIEQAFWYHRLVVDLCGLTLGLLEAKGHARPAGLAGLADAVRRGQRFLCDFSGGAGTLPDFGDRDDGYALSPYLRLSWTKQRARERFQSFPQAGYSKFIVRDTPYTCVVWDHGPLGMAPLFGHAHADALSLIVVVGERALLLDPGTYGYGLDARYREYFRGTRAHNTVTIDGCDQAHQQAAFQWSSPYRAELVRSEPVADDCLLALATHDGYAAAGCRHWRGLLVEPGTGILVWDFVEGAGEREVAAHWHCAARPDRAGENRLVFSASQPPVSLETAGATPQIVQAGVEPLLGWAATRYGVKEPISTIRLCCRSELPVSLITRIRFDGRFGPLTAERQGIDTLMRWTGHG
jgi:hypothetical protein